MKNNAYVMIADKVPLVLQALTVAKSLRNTKSACDIIIMVPPPDEDLKNFWENNISINSNGARLHQLETHHKNLLLFLKKYRGVFEELKVKVVELAAPPFDTEKIQTRFYQEYIKSTPSKVYLYKILCWNLTDYSRVCFLDVDMLVRQNLDHLFSLEEDLLYVDGPASPLCSAFFVCRPNDKIFKDLVATIERGQFNPETGWDNKGRTHKYFNAIGECQGLLYYYFLHGDSEVSYKKLPRAIYQNCGWQEVFNQLTLEQHLPLAQVKVVHFTGWKKPFDKGSNWKDSWKNPYWGKLTTIDHNNRSRLDVNDGQSPPPAGAPGPAVPFHEEWIKTFKSLNICEYRDLCK